MQVMASLLLLLLVVHTCACARILGINPTPSISHQQPFLIVMRALAERGHHVTVITTNPMKDPPPNATQIDMSFMYDMWKEDIDFLKNSLMSKSELTVVIEEHVKKACDAQLKIPGVKELQYGEKFDLVIIETFIYHCPFGLVHKMGPPPVIGFWSADLYSHLHRIVGNPVNPAYYPDFESSYTHHMNFWDRADNAYETLQSFRRFARFATSQEELMREHLGSDLPSILDMNYNISLLLATTHFSADYAKPMQPSVVQITGLHVKGKPNPLPQEIQSFLDGADHGAIYFSLGSNMKSNTLPEKTRRGLMDAFSELPQRVLWKFEDDELPGQPSNVMIAKWVPQQDVLAHKNVRLFITQGGLQSFNEASYYGVPLVAIPFFGDQGYNAGKMITAGIGVKLDFKTITKEKVLHAVRTVLDNPSYQENMERYSATYREHQEASLERAVWWVEYVIRHRGAPHLRSAARDLRWWQLLLLDVIGFIVAIVAVVALVLYKFTRWLLTLVTRPSKLKKL